MLSYKINSIGAWLGGRVGPSKVSKNISVWEGEKKNVARRSLAGVGYVAISPLITTRSHMAAWQG